MIHLRSIISMVLSEPAPPGVTQSQSTSHLQAAFWLPWCLWVFQGSFNPAGQRDFPGQATWYGWVPLGLESAVCSLEVCWVGPQLELGECFWEEREVRLQRERATPPGWSLLLDIRSVPQLGCETHLVLSEGPPPIQGRKESTSAAFPRLDWDLAPPLPLGGKHQMPC